MKLNSKRKGFTLVELLIVIVVIGILSAMMMLSSTEAVTSAKASNIVSNLRNLKTAALAYYVDHMDDYSGETTTAPALANVIPYLNGENIPELTDTNPAYAIEAVADGTTKGSWFLKYTIKGTASEVSQIKEKLKGRAKSVGLLKGSDSTSTAYDGEADVYYFVR